MDNIIQLKAKKTFELLIEFLYAAVVTMVSLLLPPVEALQFQEWSMPVDKTLNVEAEFE